MDDANYEAPLSPDEGYFLLENITTPVASSEFLKIPGASPGFSKSQSPSSTNYPATIPEDYEVPSPSKPKSATSNDHEYDFPFSLSNSATDNNYETPFDAEDASKSP